MGLVTIDPHGQKEHTGWGFCQSRCALSDHVDQ